MRGLAFAHKYQRRTPLILGGASLLWRRLLAHRLSPAPFALPLVALLLFVGGCEAPAPVPAPPPPETSVAQPPVSQDDDPEWRRLLDAAKRALAEDRLTTPDHDNAYNYYSQALALAPGNAEVVEGFERIVERYLALASRAIERERWASARSMVKRAALVDGEHPGLAPLRQQIDLLANARRLTLELDHAAVRARDADVSAQLTRLGHDARRPGARVTIRAGSDANGRWIYEQLSNASGERRIRGEIELGLPPKVTILLLPEQGGG